MAMRSRTLKGQRIAMISDIKLKDNKYAVVNTASRNYQPRSSPMGQRYAKESMIHRQFNTKIEMKLIGILDNVTTLGGLRGLYTNKK